VGYDAGKKTKGRKRHLFVDTLGLIHSLVVHAADIQDPAPGKLVLTPLLGKTARLQRIWADGRYAGGLEAWALREGGVGAGDRAAAERRQGLGDAAEAVDRGADLRLAREVPPVEQGRRGDDGEF